MGNNKISLQKLGLPEETVDEIEQVISLRTTTELIEKALQKIDASGRKILSEYLEKVVDNIVTGDDFSKAKKVFDESSGFVFQDEYDILYKKNLLSYLRRFSGGLDDLGELEMVSSLIKELEA